MHSLSLDTVLCVLQAVPCAVALAQGKDKSTKVLCIILLVLDLVIGFGHYVGLTLNNPLKEILCSAAAALGIFAAVRVTQPVLATLLVTAGCLLAALAIGFVG